jgi:hypothetical protein
VFWVLVGSNGFWWGLVFLIVVFVVFVVFVKTTKRYPPTVILSETKDLLRDDTIRTLLATWLSLVGSEEILRYAQNDRLKTTRDHRDRETEGTKARARKRKRLFANAQKLVMSN